MGDEEYGHPVVDGGPEKLQDLHLMANIEVGGGFIQYQ